jgi:hypothetical protein
MIAKALPRLTLKPFLAVRVRRSMFSFLSLTSTSVFQSAAVRGRTLKNSSAAASPQRCCHFQHRCKD